MKQTQQYLEFLEFGRKLSKNTIKSIEHDFTTFGEGLEQATRKDVERYVMDQNKKGMSTGTLARRVASIKGFFEWQQYNDYRVGINPAGGKIAPKIKNESHQAITRNELDYLYNNAPNDNIKVAIGLMGYAGMRIGEVVELGSNNHIYYDENGVLAIDLKETKGGKERKVSLALLPDEISNEPLKGQRGVYTSNGLWRILSKYFAEQGFKDLSPHALRKTFATVITKAGLHSIFTRDLLGHSSIDGNFITSKYLGSTTVEEQAQALQQLQF